MYAIRSYYGVGIRDSEKEGFEHLFECRGGRLEIALHGIVESKCAKCCLHLRYGRFEKGLFLGMQDIAGILFNGRFDLGVMVSVADQTSGHCQGKSEDDRITSYNVCYTKLLRFFCQRPHKALFQPLHPEGQRVGEP